MNEITQLVTAVLKTTPKEQLLAKLISPSTGKAIIPITLGKWQADPASVPAWAVDILMPPAREPANAPVAAATAMGPNVPVVQTSEYPGEWSNLPSWQEKKLIIAVPYTSQIYGDTSFSLLAMQARHFGKVGFDQQKGTPIGRARNMLATRFMRSNAEWLFMMDADMVPPVGSRDLYVNRWGGYKEGPWGEMDILARLVSRGKPLIGAAYVGKDYSGNAQYSAAYGSTGQNIIAHRGPVDEVKAVDWVASGALLINRSVFKSMIEKIPDAVKPFKSIESGGVYRFFSMEEEQGEDVEFCKRARAAGIQPWVDLGCHCGHIGDNIYWLHNTVART